MRWPAYLCVLGAASAAAIALVGRAAGADRELIDYKYFRALSIDLQGRPPTNDELKVFERPEFRVADWIDEHLSGPQYAQRLRRIYEDALQLEVGPQFLFTPLPLVLRRIPVIGPDGKRVFVYFRRVQRRADAATDGDFCFTPDETGLTFPLNTDPKGDGHAISAALFEQRTVLVKPWWLYSDYRAPSPSDRIGPDWGRRFPGYEPAPPLLLDADGATPATAIRVCREEAQTAEWGRVFTTGRATKDQMTPPKNRFTLFPRDSPWASKHDGDKVSCLTLTGYSSSKDCGCGVGLERCLPGADAHNDPQAFVLSTQAPLGEQAPFELQPQSTSQWARHWLGEEAAHFLDSILAGDHDVRELLTSRGTVVNGPLAQFYRGMASVTCCRAPTFGYIVPQPLVAPEAMPRDLLPQDVATWRDVPDRGPHASGLLTMPIFLVKYGSRRARAHAVYSAFLCKDFVADGVALTPSTEPDLTKRPGCSACHQKLEPMAAFFSRISETDWTYLPPEQFPIRMPRCGLDTDEPGLCKTQYDPAFGTLWGAYAAPAAVDREPSGLAAEVTASPDFAGCVVQRVAESFLGRDLHQSDAAWKQDLVAVFVAGGYRMKPLLRAVLTSSRYAAAERR